VPKNPELTPITETKNRFAGKIKRLSAAVLFTFFAGTFMHSAEEAQDIIVLPAANNQIYFNQDTPTIATSNVHGWRDESGKPNINKVMRTIEHVDADITCLQEVYAGNELNKLSELGYNIIFAATKYDFYRGQFGNVVMSKYSLKPVEVISLPSDSEGIPRNAMIQQLRTKNGNYTFLNTHLSYDDQARVRQENAIIHASEKLKTNINSLCGDFNQTRTELASSRFGKQFGINGAIMSTPNTYPSTEPGLAIDFILDNCEVRRPDIEYETFKVGSDHMMLARTYNSACS